MNEFTRLYMNDADFFVEITAGFMVGFVMVTLCAFAIFMMFKAKK